MLFELMIFDANKLPVIVPATIVFEAFTELMLMLLPDTELEPNFGPVIVPSAISDATTVPAAM